jgi:GTPase SAR1 family protein
VQHQNVHFTVWDLGGQDQLRAVWSTYFQNTDAVIMVVDSSDAARLPLVQTELRRVLADEQLGMFFASAFCL